MCDWCGVGLIFVCGKGGLVECESVDKLLMMYMELVDRLVVCV